jgi:hypothetical protein
MRFRFMPVVLLALISVPIHGETNCGSMLRTMSRFRGTVRSVKPLAGSGAAAMPVDLDPKFVVAIDADDGEHLLLGIHSPSRTFGTGRAVGRSFDFDAERMECDGKFRSLLTLQQHSAKKPVESMKYWLDVGHTYRAKVEWDPDHGLELAEQLPLPMHHDGGLTWLNADDFAGRANAHAAREVVFEVVSVHITQQAEWQWLSIYDVRIIELR